MRSTIASLFICSTFCVAQRFITESSCEDRNSTECQIFVKEYPSYCFKPSNHHPCAESCGVSKCKDYHSACMRDAKIICFDGRDYHCPKMCGNCNVCEDLVHSSLCRKARIVVKKILILDIPAEKHVKSAVMINFVMMQCQTLHIVVLCLNKRILYSSNVFRNNEKNVS
nr:uncharacterized protein LOC121128284 isoform X2 [Lepeophtheirus salmonis]